MSETNANKESDKQNKSNVGNNTETKTGPKGDDKSQDLTADDLEVYPERRGGKIKKNWLERKVDREGYNKIICEKKVYEVIKQSNYHLVTNQ